jgi:hypothetical protein
MRIEISPPGRGYPAATFRFAWEGAGSGSPSRVICLVSGDQAELVPRGERRSVPIRAHARELQRIVVDGTPHLVAIPPGETIGLDDNPCFFYEMYGPRTDPWFVDPPHAYCSAVGEPCRAGYFRASPPRPVEDPLCGPTDPDIRRCVADAEVRVASVPGVTPSAPATDDADEPIPVAALAGRDALRLAPSTCGFTAIATGTETAALVVGAGEQWSLTVDPTGRLSGTVELR